MKEVKASVFVGYGQSKFLEKLIDEFRCQYKEIGYDYSDQDVLDLLFEKVLLKECEKLGYKG